MSLHLLKKLSIDLDSKGLDLKQAWGVCGGILGIRKKQFVHQQKSEIPQKLQSQEYQGEGQPERNRGPQEKPTAHFIFLGLPVRPRPLEAGLCVLWEVSTP